MNALVTQLCQGAVAGFGATGPMTVLMDALKQAQGDPEPLPPRQITGRLVEESGAKPFVSRETEHDLTILNHFGFGTTAGALYGPIAEACPLPPVLAGVSYALGVWAVSYLGWIPAVGLYRSATEEPPNRNVTMLAGHVLWGACLGLAVESMRKGRVSGPAHRPKGG
jgi:uncharacterized membrane protein YagU involved in acid resistance